MDRRAPYMGRPAAGTSWVSLARSATGPWLFGGRILLGTIVWLWVGFGFGRWIWLDNAMVEEIRLMKTWRRWFQQQLRNIFGGVLVAPPQHFFYSRALTIHHSMLIVWIATCVYFTWSPELTRLGLVVCFVGSWIPAFTHAPDRRASLDKVEELVMASTDVDATPPDSEQIKIYNSSADVFYLTIVYLEYDSRA
ncbi:hypothetical protein B0H19DRAFT_1241846 [Mycena capillaripes]|nr:hypothetical protein B0H19DRAFT_1241846 [Mycena capillaripes]